MTGATRLESTASGDRPPGLARRDLLGEPRPDTPAQLTVPDNYQLPDAPRVDRDPSSLTGPVDDEVLPGFLYSAVVQDFELRDPSEYPAIRAKVASIKTRREAAMYAWDVAARMEARRRAERSQSAVIETLSKYNVPEEQAPSGRSAAVANWIWSKILRQSSRATPARPSRTWIPSFTRGRSLLSGNVFRNASVLKGLSGRVVRQLGGLCVLVSRR